MLGRTQAFDVRVSRSDIASAVIDPGLLHLCLRLVQKVEEVPALIVKGPPGGLHRGERVRDGAKRVFLVAYRDIDGVREQGMLLYFRQGESNGLNRGDGLFSRRDDFRVILRRVPSRRNAGRRYEEDRVYGTFHWPE